MKTVLMVAEKPSLASSIAKILSRGSANSRKGLSNACSVHEYKDQFRGEPALFKVTSVCGHVMALDFEGKYNNWDKVDPSELFIAPTCKKESNPKLNIIKFLSKEAKDSDYIVLWLDCDREGENICYEVLDITLPVMRRSNRNSSEGVVFRAHFSAITDKDIHAAMKNLGKPNENEAKAVDARQELDLRVGCAFTRFQTKYFQGKYGNLDSSLISYGPCQTPTLAFCVERHDTIQSFKPETYWQIEVNVKCPGDGPVILLDWARGRVFDQHVANMFLNGLKECKIALVLAVKSEEKKKQRPLALNTVEMLRVASSSLGIGPQQTMQAAEHLYIQGYISYPRTETTHYPENFDFRAPVSQQSSAPWGKFAQNLLQNGIGKPRKGSDAGDHPPITPMRLAREGDLGHDQWRLYEYVVRHFLATLSADCTYLHTEIILKVGDEKFKCSGNSPLVPGFTEIMPWQSISDQQTLPKLNKGDECSIEKVSLVERKTGPPDYLTESELITLMEKHGIGTDASIPTHINNIVQRNYATVLSKRRLQPTSLGIVLVHGYKRIDHDLALPTIRSAVEKQLNLIAQGKAEYRDVLRHASTIFQQKFHFFVEHVLSMDKLFEVSFTPLAESGKSMSRCGKCRRYMKYIAAAPPRLHCSTCDETYDLPLKTNIKLYKEIKCPLDEFELLLCSTGSQGKNYSLCPYCYNYPPFKDMRKGSGCNSCTHPACVHSRSTLGVAACMSCENGILVLDMASAPKWKLACNDNRCSTVVTLFQNAHKILVTEDACEKCSAYELAVDFHKEKTPLPDKETKRVGCVFCDEVFSDLIKLKQARLQVKRQPVGNRGGRGRSRGRGRRAPKDKMSQLAAYFV